MAHPRRFRFGLKFRATKDGAQLADLARRAESLGYSTILVSDHPTHPQLAPLTAAAALACATTRLRVGSSVLANDFRHPIVLAKEIATLDRISGGRVELGLGTGWKKAEYEAMGLEFDAASQRIERLREAIGILRGFWSGESYALDRKHYSIRDVVGFPTPVQNPLPILIGGGGKKVLSLAAQTADIVGINPAARSGAHDLETDLDSTEEATAEKVRWIAEAAGTRMAELELCMQVYADAVTESRAEADQVLSKRYAFPLELSRRVPYAWIGSVGQICDSLEANRERWGVSYWVVPEHAMESLAPVVARLSGR
ncbi:MAG: TIGR03621 family F420-dependent LLM class oxidoreductase [Isosphaeraceae bacterium]|nr:TIGR03621 family F420-dependent LLM class oxidoreductase [Isosphaeraceae bacterium]